MNQILKFTSKNCGPCQGLNMTLANQDLGVPVVSVDADTDRDSVLEYGIRAVPTMILIRDGVEVARMSGAQPIDKIRAWAQQGI